MDDALPTWLSIFYYYFYVFSIIEIICSCHNGRFCRFFFFLLFLNSYNRDETVEVGAPLYEIDTDATASVTGADSNGGGDSVDSSGSSSTSSTSASAGDSAKPEAPPPATKEKQSNKPSATPSEKKEHRTPSIQFLGKEGWAARLTPAPVVELPPIHPMFGRPAFSEEEMEAIMLGGAEQAPKVVAHSSGAKFA